MPKVPKTKIYAVRSGREGPQIYHSVEDFKKATHHFSGSIGKSFRSRAKAEKWLSSKPNQLKSSVCQMIQRPKQQPELGVGSGSDDPDGVETRVRVHRADDAVELSLDISVNVKGDPLSSLGCDGISMNYNLQTDIFLDMLGDLDDIRIEASSKVSISTVPSKATSEPSTPVMKLSPEQQQVLDIVQRGGNVFFTGPAGTGKSMLLSEIISCVRRSKRGSLAITAPTGIAGLNIGGTTIHSFAGIGLGNESVTTLCRKISLSPRLSSRWRETETLIIDEISMLDGILFDKLEMIARLVRESTDPFGGIQLILCGDFFQLPPVPDLGAPATFAFDAKSWGRCIGTPIMLTRVFRQKENDFVDMLSTMRTGYLRPEHILKWKQLSRPIAYSDGIEPSLLFPLRAQVEACNSTRLEELPDPSFTYISMDSRGYNADCEPIHEKKALQLLDRLIALREIKLKVNAQVMLIRNISHQLVNGSLGRVIDFITTHEARDRNIMIAVIEASKADNSPLDHINDFPGLKKRIRRIPQTLLPLDGTVFSKEQFWPLVRFSSGQEMLCSPVPFTAEGVLGNIEVQRMQVPLILSWALSIHKSQGQTLSRVKVDLGRIFEKGQAYVALSRATTLDQLEVVNFHPSRIMAHPRVVAWHKSWMQPEPEEEMDREDAIAQYYDSIPSDLQ